MNKTGIYGLAASMAVGQTLQAGAVIAQNLQGHGTGMRMQNHDEAAIPGLRGENAPPAESAELAVLFRNLETITREVENLPNGIRIVTRSSDPEVMDTLVNHAVGMIDRVGGKDDPKIIIQSPTLDVMFLHGDEILSDVETPDEGLVAVQTLDNPEPVKALQVHAAEVTDMADRGMAVVHDMMMQQGRSH